MTGKYNSLLPIHVQKELMQAAAIDKETAGRTESRRRTTALEDVLERARLFNPECFQPEEK